MNCRVRYQSRAQPSRMIDEEPEFYWPGDRVGIEVWDHEDSEYHEDTGLLDHRGQPIIRITKVVRPPIGFIHKARDE